MSLSRHDRERLVDHGVDALEHAGYGGTVARAMREIVEIVVDSFGLSRDRRVTGERYECVDGFPLLPNGRCAVHMPTVKCERLTRRVPVLQVEALAEQCGGRVPPGVAAVGRGGCVG